MERHQLSHEYPVLCKCGEFIGKEGMIVHLASFKHTEKLEDKELEKQIKKLKVEDGRADKRNQRAIQSLARTRDDLGTVWLVQDGKGERESGSVRRGTNRNGEWIRPSTTYASIRRNPRPDL